MARATIIAIHCCEHNIIPCGIATHHVAIGARKPLGADTIRPLEEVFAVADTSIETIRVPSARESLTSGSAIVLTTLTHVPMKLAPIITIIVVRSRRCRCKLAVNTFEPRIANASSVLATPMTVARQTVTSYPAISRRGTGSGDTKPKINEKVGESQHFGLFNCNHG